MSSQSSTTRVIWPAAANVICSFILVALAFALLGFFSFAFVRDYAEASQDPLARIFFVFIGVVGIGLIVMALSAMSAHAELTPDRIVLRTLFRTKALPISEIVSALIGWSRNVPFLAVRTGDKSIVFSGQSFSRPQLQEIQDYVADAGRRISRTIQTEYPQSPPLSEKAVYELIAAHQLIILGIVVGLVIFVGIPHLHRMH